MPNDFDIDLEASGRIEDEAERRIRKLGFLTENTRNKGNFPYYDISITSATTSRVYKAEVKYNATIANEVFIEIGKYVGNNRVDCGLTITTSTHYILSFDEDPNYYIIRTPVLKKLVAKKNTSKNG